MGMVLLWHQDENGTAVASLRTSGMNGTAAVAMRREWY